MGLLQQMAGGFFGKGSYRGALGGAIKAGLSVPATERGIGWTVGSGLRNAFGGGAARGAMFGAGLGAINGALSADSSMLGGALKGAAYGYGAGAVGLGLQMGARRGIGAGLGTAWRNARYGYRGFTRPQLGKIAVSNAASTIGKTVLPSNSSGKVIRGIHNRGPSMTTAPATNRPRRIIRGRKHDARAGRMAARNVF